MWKQKKVRATTAEEYRPRCRTIGTAGRVQELLKTTGIFIFAFTLCSLSGGAQTLYNFTGGADGQAPFGGLTAGRNGVLYGTTSISLVDPACPYTTECGTVFQLVPPSSPGGAWIKSVIDSFSVTNAGTNSGYPLSTPVLGTNGNLYGTTAYGDMGNGEIYELSPPSSRSKTWTETVLYSFPTGNAASRFPQGGVVVGKDGALYGTAIYAYSGNCSGCGEVYSLTPPVSKGGDWTYQPLYTFEGVGPGLHDGAYPLTTLTLGNNGELYGATNAGGSGSVCAHDAIPAPIFLDPYPGCGTVFELAPPTSAGGAWTETVLYSFQGKSDGGFPNAVLYHDGALYGTVAFGGDPKNCGGVGCGGVFRLAQPTVPGASWHEKVIYSFTSGKDGFTPNGSVAFGAGGTLYGATRDGGNSDSCPENPGCGIVFQLKPPLSSFEDWSETVVHRFAVADGWQPTGSVVIGGDGSVYGTTYFGGSSTNCQGGCGVVFRAETGTAEERSDQDRGSGRQ